MRSRHRRFIGGMALAMAAMVLALVLWPVARASAQDFNIYVDATAVDSTEKGTKENPFKSLADAFSYIYNDKNGYNLNDQIKVYVMSDLTATSTASYWNRNVTVIGLGNQWTITRGKDFTPTIDEQRGGYNGPMIEVGNSGSLTIKNLILDDAGNHMGMHFVQVANNHGITEIGGEDVDNDDIVQDAIITTFSKDFTITLGENCQLKNFGGMSAVRVANGTLIMQEGSAISDNGSVTRTKQKDDYGYAGAVWVQSGKFVLEKGASIHHTSGHAVYADGAGSNVTINGDIKYITIDGQSWQNGLGIIHLRGNSTCALNGSIENISPGNDGVEKYAVAVVDSVFTMNKDSKLNVMGTGVSGISSRGNGGASVLINGTVTGVNDATVLHINVTSAPNPTSQPVTAPTQLELGPDGWIKENRTNWLGILYMQVVGGKFDIKGHIEDNFGTGLWLAGNNGSTDVTMYEGATIRNNCFDGYTFRLNKCIFTMEGGSIDHNINAGLGESAGVSVSGGGVFIMNGGSIENNVNAGQVGAVSFDSKTSSLHNGDITQNEKHPNAYFYPRIELNGGVISNNIMGATVIEPSDGARYTYTDGIPAGVSVSSRGDNDANGTYGSSFGHSGKKDYYDNHKTNLTDKSSNYYYNYSFEENDWGPKYITISTQASIDVTAVQMLQSDFAISGVEGGFSLANTAHDNEIAAANAFSSEHLTEVKGSFWYKTTGAASHEVSISDLVYDETKPLYAAVMATGEDGKAADDAVVSLQAIETDADNGSFSLSLPGESATGYAVVFLQQAPDDPDAKVVTVTPVDVTVYEGGKGYTAVVDGSETTTNNSMPHPLFTIKGVENVNGLTFSNGTGGKTWTAVPDGTNSDGTNNYYHFEPSPGNDQGDVRVTYTNAAGKTVTSDKFEVPDVGDTFEQFTIGLYLGENNLAHITASKGSDNYAVALGTGTLTVRAIQANNPDTVVSEVISQGSLESQKSGEAVAVAPVGTTYTLNNIGVALPDDAKPSLLFDDIINEAGNDRTGALVDAIEEQSRSTVDEECYQAKYLDLVDANNSNAWIKASNPVTVYWGYPKGTDKSTNFKLYHFRDLHRDGANSGYDVEDIDATRIETVDNVKNTNEGIAFTVESGGFSPFVLVWDRPSGGSVTPPAATHTITATAGSGGSISPSGEVAVTEGFDQAFAITPDEGNKVRDVTIDGKSVGALGSYTFEDVRGDHTISVTFTRGNAPADPDDTGVSDWFETGDHDAFMHGYDDGTGRFGPDDNMTRGEAAQMFYNMLRDKSRGDVRFDFEDLSEGAWYYEAVATMASHGILLGTSPTTVEPERPITRAEFTAMAMRFSKGDLSGENIFTDVSEGDWYYGVVVGSIKYGWISGYDDGTGRFGPNDNITRAQATTIANRMLGRVADGVFVSAHLDEIRRFPDVDEGFYAFLDIAEATNSHDYAKDGGFEHWSALR